MPQSVSVLSRPPRHLIAVLGLIVATACNEAKSGAADSDVTSAATDTTAPTAATAGGSAADTSHSGTDHSQMGGMTGNPDQDFLRMMSDHHKGLIALAHLTKDGKGSTESVRTDARKLDTAQDAELDTMTTMLETSFKDPYEPKILPKHQAMADSLERQTGAAYDRTFYQDVVVHHQEGVKMMEEYLPKLTRPELKRMVQRMREMQTREITEFQQKRRALPS